MSIWHDSRYVCYECFGDNAIREFIKDNAVEPFCSFCGKRSKKEISAPLKDVVSFMELCIQEEYDDPANCLPYESAEGGYQGETWEIYELLRDEIELHLPKDDDQKLLQTICDSFEQDLWCQRDPFGLNKEQFARFSWERFCDVVKHKLRYFFTKEKSNHDRETLTPLQTLENIFEYSKKIGLFVPLEAGVKLFRARHKKKGWILRTALELGPPSVELAIQANRMSPPGIVMFYLSDSPETALRETANKPGRFVVGCWKTSREAIILDLTKIPVIPTLFEKISDSLEYDPRRVLIFLHEVSREISKPIPRNDRINIDYVPTQVVTEYIKTRLLSKKRKIEGIRYPSSVHPGHVSYVLFADQKSILPVHKKSFPHEDLNRWIKLSGKTSHIVKQKDLEIWNKEVENIDWFLKK